VTTPPRLLGTYQTPAFSYGDVVRCDRRGEVRIVGLSDAPIPWPIAQTLPNGRARSLVLYGAVNAVGRRCRTRPASCTLTPVTVPRNETARRR
jgi:hypothetical protein